MHLNKIFGTIDNTKNVKELQKQLFKYLYKELVSLDTYSIRSFC